NPKAPGVRVYSSHENTIRGWIEAGLGFGHAYGEPVKHPPDIRFLPEEWTKEIETSSWFAYSRKNPADASDEREHQFARIIRAMQEAGKVLRSSASAPL